MSDLDACAALVQAGDPGRFRTAMLAPMPVRGDLLVLYAFNIEVSRAPWVASEPMIAEMRVQWWADAVREIYEGGLRRHEVVTPLGEVVARHGLDRATLEGLVEARRVECWPEPFDIYPFLDATSGSLMALAAAMLGDAPGARDHGFGAGAAALIRGLPALSARGRRVEGLDVKALARDGQARRKAARAAGADRAVQPALLAGWDADAVLADAIVRGEGVRETPYTSSEFRRRATVLMRQVTGRW